MTKNLYTTDFPVGQKVLSKDHQQPGIVIATGYQSGHEWFEVEWVRHPGKTRRYFTGSDHEQQWDYHTWPTPVSHFEWEEDELADWEREILSAAQVKPNLTELLNEPSVFVEPRTLTFVDTFAGMRQSVQDALVKSLVEVGESSVGLDINKFLAALTDAGWSPPPVS